MKKYLSPGEKIKKLRTALGIKQEDIADNKISKSLISMIERDKRGLTKESAIIIANKLNKHYGKSGKEITPEFLLETEKDVARKEILKDIKHLDKAIRSHQIDSELIKNTLEKVRSMVMEGNFQQEYIRLIELQGDFHFRNYQFSDAIDDYLDVIGHSIKSNDYSLIAKMYIALGTTYLMQMMVETAVIHYSKAVTTVIEHNTNNKDEIRIYAMFNQILCYRRLKRYDLVLGQIGVFKEYKWDNPLYGVYYNRVIIIEANTYRDLENWDKAKGIYEKLLSDEKKLDKETLFLVYENYGVYHRNKGHKVKALKYLRKAYDIKDQVDYNYMPALYLYEATCYNLEEEYDKVITLLEDGLRLADLVGKKHMLIELRFAFVEVALRLKDYDTALQQLAIIEELLKANVVKPLFHDLYSYYAQVYLGMGDLAKSIEYNRKILHKDYFWD